MILATGFDRADPLASLLILSGNAGTPGKGFPEGPFGSQVELRELVDLAEQRGVVEHGEQLNQVCIAGSALHGQRTLGRGGQHEHRIQRFGNLGQPAETGHTGPGENDGVQVGLRAVHPGDTTVDVPADRRDLQL